MVMLISDRVARINSNQESLRVRSREEREGGRE